MDKKAIPLDVNNLPEVLRELTGAQYDQRVAVCNRAGICIDTLRHWLNRKTYPRLDLLCYVLDTLGKRLVIVDK